MFRLLQDSEDTTVNVYRDRKYRYNEQVHTSVIINWGWSVVDSKRVQREEVRIRSKTKV